MNKFILTKKEIYCIIAFMKNKINSYMKSIEEKREELLFNSIYKKTNINLRSDSIEKYSDRLTSIIGHHPNHEYQTFLFDGVEIITIFQPLFSSHIDSNISDNYTIKTELRYILH